MSKKVVKTKSNKTYNIVTIIIVTMFIVILAYLIYNASQIDFDAKREEIKAEHAQIIREQMEAQGWTYTPPQSVSILDNDNYNYTETNSEEVRDLLEEAGLDPNTDISTLDSGLSVAGGKTYAIKEYRSLHDAEEDMGYYLGLRNRIENFKQFELVAMYNIGNGKWYQAIYQLDPNYVHQHNTQVDGHALVNSGSQSTNSNSTDDDNSNNMESTDDGDESGFYGNQPVFAVKTSKNVDSNELIDGYKVDSQYNIKSDETISGIKVYLYSSIEESYNVARFDTPNGKAYSIYTSNGFSLRLMNLILEELIDNIQSMDDWVE